MGIVRVVVRGGDRRGQVPSDDHQKERDDGQHVQMAQTTHEYGPQLEVGADQAAPPRFAALEGTPPRGPTRRIGSSDPRGLPVHECCAERLAAQFPHPRTGQRPRACQHDFFHREREVAP